MTHETTDTTADIERITEEIRHNFAELLTADEALIPDIERRRAS